MRWHEASASPSCSFAKVRQENGQSGTLCFQETAMPRAKREHDQMMPQRFHCFFRSTATNHTQARQQARRDTIMMRYCIQNLRSSCEGEGFMFRAWWKKWFLTLDGDVTLWNLTLLSCCHIVVVVLEQDSIPWLVGRSSSKSEGHKGEHQQPSIHIYPIDSDLPPGFCNISDG